MYLSYEHCIQWERCIQLHSGFSLFIPYAPLLNFSHRRKGLSRSQRCDPPSCCQLSGRPAVPSQLSRWKPPAQLSRISKWKHFHLSSFPERNQSSFLSSPGWKCVLVHAVLQWGQPSCCSTAARPAGRALSCRMHGAGATEQLLPAPSTQLGSVCAGSTQPGCAAEQPPTAWACACISALLLYWNFPMQHER